MFERWLKDNKIESKFPNIWHLVKPTIEQAYRAGYNQGLEDGIVDEQMRRTNHD